MRLKVYIETTIVSYLTAWPSRDLVRAAQQQVTRDWWDSQRRFDLFVSQFVLDEAGSGDPDAAGRRLAAIEETPLLEVVEPAILLAEELVAGGALPKGARVDALHVAMTAVHGIDYLLTWNCKHIANASLRARIEHLCRASGFEPPVICTPFELIEEDQDGT